MKNEEVGLDVFLAPFRPKGLRLFYLHFIFPLPACPLGSTSSFLVMAQEVMSSLFVGSRIMSLKS